MSFSSFGTIASFVFEPVREKLQHSLLGSPKNPFKALPSLNDVLVETDRALKTLTVTPFPNREYPGTHTQDPADEFTPETRKQVAGLMRVNHTGEICAQALYFGQALGTATHKKRTLFLNAAKEETDHLAWTAKRLETLKDKPSILNPLWYTGSFAIGFLASKLGDEISLGFMAETEKQVEDHLNTHLDLLPINDDTTKAIIHQMKADEMAHAQTAINHGAKQMPTPVRYSMAGVAKIMKLIAYRI